MKQYIKSAVFFGAALFFATTSLVWLPRAADATASCPTDLLSGLTPSDTNYNDSSSVNIGVKFKVNGAPFVRGVKFYKGTGNTGTHIAHLRKVGGTSDLASATFSSETSSGWQTVNFSSDIQLDTSGGDTTYIVWVSMPNGHYAYTSTAFQYNSVGNPAEDVAYIPQGQSSLYTYTSDHTATPSNTTYDNFFVEPIVGDTTAPDNNAGVSASDATGGPSLTWSAAGPDTSSALATASPVKTQITRNDGSSSVVIGTQGGGLSHWYDVGSNTQVDNTALPGTSYTYTVKNTDGCGNVSSGTSSSSITTAAQTLDHIFTSTPSTLDSGQTSPTVFGMHWQTATAGKLWGVRFYRNATTMPTVADSNGLPTAFKVSLWDNNGTQLASAYTAPNNEQTGWIDVRFASPVTVSANHDYVVGYFSPNGREVYTDNVFSSAVANGDLSARANGVSTPNGVYASGFGTTANTFPNTASASATWYGVDVDFFSADVDAPSAPSSLSVNDTNGYITNLSWTASTDNVGVTGYKIYRDDTLIGTSTATTYKDQTVVPGNTYEYYVKATDAANNLSSASSEPSITLQSTSIWMSFDTPDTFSNDGVPLELGVKFRPLVNGQVKGIRFYKASGDTGTHVGTLWTAGGSSLATATFSSETSSGWQEVTFSSPVSVTANTTYVASYTTPQGKYGASSSYFASVGITSQYLKALASGVDGNNGVYNTTGGSFPTSSFNNTNYWVDVSFIPNTAAGGPSVTTVDSEQVYPGYPGSNNTGVVGQRLPVRDRSVDIVNSGTTISNVEFDIPDFYIPEDNTTFQNVKVVYTGELHAGFTIFNIPVGVTGTTFEDCEIDGQSNIARAIKGNDDVTVTRCNIHHTANAVEAADGTAVVDSYLHDIFTPEGQDWHADGIQSPGSANDLIVSHNTIFLTGGETGAVNFQGTSGDTLNNVLVEDNLMAGGGYTVYVGAGTNTDVSVVNNQFSTRYYTTVGAFNIYYPDWLSGVTISGNTIYETSASANGNF